MKRPSGSTWTLRSMMALSPFGSVEVKLTHAGRRGEARRGPRSCRSHRASPRRRSGSACCADRSSRGPRAPRRGRAIPSAGRSAVRCAASGSALAGSELGDRDRRVDQHRGSRRGGARGIGIVLVAAVPQRGRGRRNGRRDRRGHRRCGGRRLRSGRVRGSAAIGTGSALRGTARARRSAGGAVDVSTIAGAAAVVEAVNNGAGAADRFCRRVHGWRGRDRWRRRQRRIFGEDQRRCARRRRRKRIRAARALGGIG